MKLAILGASPNQLSAVEKAKELGYYTIVFGWSAPDDISAYADKFYDISITEYDTIVEICRRENVVGVCSNMADVTALACSYITNKLNLPGPKYDVMKMISDKCKVRELTAAVKGLSTPWSFVIDLNSDNASESRPLSYPCIVKPCTASGKIGVSFCNCDDDFYRALEYANAKSSHIIVEQYIGGMEVSVETISHNNNHYILQITDKETSGAPHFVEISHHQPSSITAQLQQRIADVVKGILAALSYDEAAAHIEMKITGNDIYLIEINPRGGGGFISTVLTHLTTGYDYLKAIVNLSVGKFENPPVLKSICHSGVYWLIGNYPQRVDTFHRLKDSEWVVDYKFAKGIYKKYHSNVGRDSYIIYKSDHKIDENGI